MFSIICGLLDRTRNFFYWGWKLRSNWDWDYGFLLIMIRLKLERMYQHFLDHGVAVGLSDPQDKDMKRLKVCIELLKRMEDGELDIQKTYFKNRMWKSKSFSRSLGVLEIENSKDIEDRESLVRELFWNTFVKHYRKWWD